MIYFVDVFKLPFWSHLTSPYFLNSKYKEEVDLEHTHLNLSGPFHSHARVVSSRWHSRNCYMCRGYFFPISKIPL